MKNHITNFLIALFISAPIVFVMLFLGYFPLHYNIILHTDNVVGEGICQSFVCPTEGYAAYYETEFYFGSELKKATIKGYHYDVDEVTFIISDVDKFDITSIDSYYKGIHLAHFEPQDILSYGETVEGTTAVLTSRAAGFHVEVKNPAEGTTIALDKEFIPIWFWIAYFTIIFISVILMAVLFAVIIERIPMIRLPLLTVSCIVVTLLAGSFFCGSLSYITYNNFILNWLFLFIAAMLVNALTLPFVGTVFVMLVTTGWYVANYFVILFRNKPIMPSDLKVIGTAAEVVKGYSFIPTWKMVLGVCIVVLYIFLLVITWKQSIRNKNNIRRNIILRAASIAVAIALFIVGTNTNTFKSLESFAWDAMLMKSFHEEGMVLTFIHSVFNSGLQQPNGYSKELANKYLAEYQEDTIIDRNAIQPTNIIMVMDEAYSDLRTVGLDSNIDVMPYVDSLVDNTVSGDLYVSIFGGGTCNTEFEALTGNTLAFLGIGAYPYTENITKPMFSLAEYFSSIGYSTDAFHANDARNWNRNVVYPNLGFDSFHSIEDYNAFGDVTYLHDQPAEISDYLYMESVSAQNKGSRRFLFNVTMQNHSGYERWIDVEEDETVKEYGSELYQDARIYLSLIKATDEEIQQLVDTYRDSDEPTMIIVFGDHQPGLPETAINQIYTNINSNLDFYKTKFFIWTNYDSPEMQNAGLSANYLSWLILDQGNFELPPYIQMLKEVYESYPIISTQGVLSANGDIYSGVADIMDDPLMKKYQYIQYANMMGELDEAWFKVKSNK